MFLYCWACPISELCGFVLRNRKPYIISFIAVSLLQTGLEAGNKNKSADLLQHQGHVFFSRLLIAFKTVLMPKVIGQRVLQGKHWELMGEKKKKIKTLDQLYWEHDKITAA